MGGRLEGRARELVEARNFAFVGTVASNGVPYVNPVWIHTEDGKVTLNSAEGRKWQARVRRSGRLTITVLDMSNPYNYVTIIGRLAAATHEDADEHIDQLAKKYLDAEAYPFRQPGERRVKLVIEPERVVYRGT